MDELQEKTKELNEAIKTYQTQWADILTLLRELEDLWKKPI